MPHLQSVLLVQYIDFHLLMKLLVCEPSIELFVFMI